MVRHHLQALRTNLRAQHRSYGGDRVRYTGRVKPTAHERSCEWKIAFGADVNPKYGSRPHAKALLTTKSTNRLIGDLC